MDTSSSPWDTPAAENSSSAASATGWADFDAFSSSAASDSASSDVIEKQQSEVMNVEVEMCKLSVTTFGKRVKFSDKNQALQRVSTLKTACRGY